MVEKSKQLTFKIETKKDNVEDAFAKTKLQTINDYVSVENINKITGIEIEIIRSFVSKKVRENNNNNNNNKRNIVIWSGTKEQHNKIFFLNILCVKLFHILNNKSCNGFHNKKLSNKYIRRIFREEKIINNETVIEFFINKNIIEYDDITKIIENVKDLINKKENVTIDNDNIINKKETIEDLIKQHIKTCLINNIDEISFKFNNENFKININEIINMVLSNQ